MIAAIHGACIGGATNMVTFADIRYCTKDSYFQVKEAALGKKGKTVKAFSLIGRATNDKSFSFNKVGD